MPCLLSDTSYWFTLKVNIFISIYYLMNKNDSILYLTRAKILSCIPFDNSDKIFSLEDSITSDSLISGKKKSGLNYKTVDTLEGKKAKNRHRKKEKTEPSIAEILPAIKSGLSVREIASAALMSTLKDVKGKQLKGKKYKLNNELLANDKVVNEIYLDDPLTVKDLATKLSIPSADIIKWLFLKGISVTINQLLDTSISKLVAEHYLFKVLKQDTSVKVKKIDSSCEQKGRSRAPIITLLGHVDHGKTTLLRAIKQDSIDVLEAGNITQSIGSYEIFINNNSSNDKLIFLDTPGHEAFVGMRKRGASITDIVVLVVSAVDGLQPQTIEVIEYVKDRNLPLIVAINKIDKPEADVAKVKKQLLAFDIIDSSIDGNNTIISVSALKYQNVDQLLFSIVALSKTRNLLSDPSMPAEGTILEAYLNRQKGPVAQLLIRNGTLYIGDVILAGNFYGKVKAINNSANMQVKSIESMALADVLCFTEVPTAGLCFKVVADEKKAKILAARCIRPSAFTALNSRISLDNPDQKYAKKIINQVNLIIKTDVQGAIDAIVHTLSSVPQEKVQINLLLAAPGEVSLKDIELAAASDSLILVFGLSLSSNIIRDAEKRGVAIYAFSIIYDLIDHVKNHMLSFVDPDYEKQILGRAKVKSLFPVNKGIVAGCFIESGKLKKQSYFQVKKTGQVIYTGLIDSLKRLKDDVDEVYESNECGVMCKNYDSWEIGDLLECYELTPLEKTL